MQLPGHNRKHFEIVDCHTYVLLKCFKSGLEKLNVKSLEAKIKYLWNAFKICLFCQKQRKEIKFWKQFQEGNSLQMREDDSLKLIFISNIWTKPEKSWNIWNAIIFDVFKAMIKHEIFRRCLMKH